CPGESANRADHGRLGGCSRSISTMAVPSNGMGKTLFAIIFNSLSIQDIALQDSVLMTDKRI
ncbi:4452_t:CDS:1, partial [Acaulospora colombiana]